LQLEDGRWLRVQAAAEPIVEVTHKDPIQLMRIAWHLGNRHLPAEIRSQVLRIRPDHVIEDMLHGFGADLQKVHAPFQPEGGAYRGHGHRHDDPESGHHHE
jgi:urease accessory protein